VFTFIELPSFEQIRERYLNDEEFRALQHFLLQNPKAGEVIPGSGGCRKLRWQAEGRGKRGGLRIIYFLRPAQDHIILVTLYGKNVRENIEPSTLRKLKEAF
jgi:hypothetical protein